MTDKKGYIPFSFSWFNDTYYNENNNNDEGKHGNNDHTY